jgi:hypothetical protein
MRPSDCPKWSACSAPLCPFDPELHKRRHLRGEAMCLWVRESVKPEGRATLRGALPVVAAAAVEVAAAAIMARNSDTRTKLKAASRCGSKLNAIAHAREAVAVP